MVINSQKLKDFLPPKRFLITFAETKLTVQNKGKPRSSLKKISLEELCVFFTQTESFNFFFQYCYKVYVPTSERNREREKGRERNSEKSTPRKTVTLHSILWDVGHTRTCVQDSNCTAGHMETSHHNLHIVCWPMQNESLQYIK